MTSGRNRACGQALWKTSIRELVGAANLFPALDLEITNAPLYSPVALENMFLGQGLLWQQVWKCLSLIQPESPGISSLHQGNGSHSVDTLKECTGRLKNTLSSLSMGHLESTDPDLKNTLKRKHTSVDIDPGQSQAEPVRAGDTTKNDLPPDDLIDSLVEIYFTSIHPWIPILHVRQFREKMAAPVERQKLTTIFHAIVSLCVRFSEDPRLENPDVRARYAKRSRQTVILQSMESFSVENLQALVICAFDTVGVPYSSNLSTIPNTMIDW